MMSTIVVPAQESDVAVGPQAIAVFSKVSPVLPPQPVGFPLLPVASHAKKFSGSAATDTNQTDHIHLMCLPSQQRLVILS